MTLCQNEADVKFHMDINHQISPKEMWWSISFEILHLPHTGKGSQQLLGKYGKSWLQKHECLPSTQQLQLSRTDYCITEDSAAQG